MKILKIGNKKKSNEPFAAEDFDDTFEITEENIGEALRRVREALERNERSRQTTSGAWQSANDTNNTEEYRTRDQREEEWARRHENRERGIPPTTFEEITEQISIYATRAQLETIERACVFRETNINIEEGGAHDEEIIENNEDPQNPRYGNYPL